MAKKPIDTPLPDINVDWRVNPRDPNGLGYGGKAIMEAIQQKFTENDSRLDRIEEELGSGSVDFRFLNLPSGKVFVNGSAPYPFPIFVKSVLVSKNDEGEEVEEEYDRNVHLEIEVILNGNSTTTSLGNVAANQQLSVNIAPYVADGAAFALRAFNDSGNSRRTSYYDVVKANLGIGFQNVTWWANAYVNGDNAWVIPLLLDVNVNATLSATLTDKDGIIRSSRVIPSSQFASNYNLSLPHPALNGGSSGVYSLSLQLVATDESLSGLVSEPVVMNVCCVEALDEGNYLVVNNVGTGLKNYTSNRLFNYAVRVGFGNPSLHIVTKEGDVVVNDSGLLSVANGQVYSYSLSLEMERLDDADFTLNVSADIDEVPVFNKDFVFSNSDGYAATSGAKLLIRFNGRSNSEAKRGVFYNAIDNEEVIPSISGVAWSDSDGYVEVEQSDGSFQTCFRLLAGGRLTIPKKLLQMARFDNRSIEIDYQVHNVLDYDVPVVTCSETSANYFNGLEATPNRIAVLTPSTQSLVDDEGNSVNPFDDHSTNYDGEERNHVTVVIRSKPIGANATADNYSACMIYINGCKQRTYAYANDLNVNGDLLFGSDFADIDIYAIRVYENALTNREVETNCCNCKPTEVEKVRYRNRNNVRANGKVDYSLVRSLCNVFVIETENDTLPQISWGKNDSVSAKIEWFWKDHSDWNWSIVTDLFWQGTTSHGYLRQNLKGTSSHALDFDGGNHAAITKICFKKNFASSMQSHKIGSVLDYTDLARKCGVIDEDERASIWQYPAVGFQRMKDGTMVFIGLYTVGPDKGDKATFGFNNKSIALEMSDNEPLGSNFRLPMNDDTTTNDGETYKMNGVKSFEDAMKNPALVSQRWTPAYNFVYNCAKTIRPWFGSVASMKGNAVEGYDYWLVNADGDHAAFTLFYYNSAVGDWVPNGVNIATQTGIATDGKDADTLNDEFKAARVTLFRNGAAAHFDIDNAIFHQCYIEFKAATDNLSKNTYPYIKDCSNSSARIRWRQDDLDTIFDIENQGKAYKKYCVEIGDNYAAYGRNPQSVFNGINNQFWVLLREAFASEYEEFMRSRFIPALHYGGTADPLRMTMQHFEHYYFANAQEHFPEALYNEDAKYCYEEAALMGQSYGYSGIALSQCLGNHYSAEKYWVKMRYIYMASKYNADNFSLGTQTDTFRTRPYNPDDGVGNSFEITPAIYMYPSVQEGNSKIIRGFRIYPGEERKTWSVTLEASETSDQEQRVNGMSYIRSLGNLYRNAFRETVTVNGKMLTELPLGSKDNAAAIRSRVTGVVVGDASALRKVDLANLSTLQGVNDFSKCVNLRELYADNTNVTSILLCDGGPLERLHLPESIMALALYGKRSLTDLLIAGHDNVISLEAGNCSDYVMGKVLDILTTKYNA